MYSPLKAHSMISSMRLSETDKALGEGTLGLRVKAHIDDVFAFIRERGGDAFHAGAKAWVFRRHRDLLGQLFRNTREANVDVQAAGEVSTSYAVLPVRV